jgi:hypothetical protein
VTDHFKEPFLELLGGAREPAVVEPPADRVEHRSEYEHPNPDKEQGHAAHHCDAGSKLGAITLSRSAHSPASNATSKTASSKVLGLTWPILWLIAFILMLVLASILLFRSDFINDVDARLLTLFAVAGALGGALRSFAYGLASGSFTQRERRQWATEALVAPVTGVVAGLLAYLVVRASLVASISALNQYGQYIVSLVAGALALRPLASIVERGLLSSSMSRSGILGGEVSPSVPVLDRIEKILEQRVTESSLSNYNGWVDVVARAMPSLRWELDVALRSSGEESARVSDDERVHSARIVVLGGDDRDAVLFGISVVSKTYVPSPPLLSISTPHYGRSEVATIFLESAEEPGGPTAGDNELRIEEAAVLIEVGQGTKTLVVLRVPLEEE